MKIVYEGKTKLGKDLLFRYVEEGDAPLMLDYINTLSKEETFILMQGEQLTLSEEEKFLHEHLELIAKSAGILLLAFCGNDLVGISGINLKNRVHNHVGVLGISVAKNFREDGIGRLLLERTMDEARKVLPNLQIITLDVFSTNTKAIQLYEKCGFKEYGRLPEGVKYKDVFVDSISMYKAVK